MRAAVITSFKQPWELKELPNPKPAPGQVLIKVHASGMCGTDVHVHNGHFGLPAPLVAGHEPAGEIVELGAGVTDFKVGDRVGAFWHQHGCGRCASCQAGHPQYCATVQSWMHVGGANSELMIAWASGCALLPEGLSYVDAAPIFCAGFTVMSGLRNADPKPGERVAVLGVGGLGHLGVQFAARLGFETVAIARGTEKEGLARELGAHHYVDSTAGDPGAALAELGGASVILATVTAADAMSACLGGLAPDGKMVVLGAAPDPIEVPPTALIGGSRSIVGHPSGTSMDSEDTLGFSSLSGVRARIETMPLEQANESYARMMAGDARFRMVLTM